MRSRLDIRLLLAGTLAVGLLVWFLRGLHWQDLGEALVTVQVRWLLIAVGFLLAEVLLRAVRWGNIVRSVDPDCPLSELVQATTIGSAFNTFLPLRGGDIIRPALLAKRRGLPFSTVLSTTVVERLYDAFGAVGTLLVLVMLLPEEWSGDGASAAQLRSWGIGLGTMALVGLGVVVLLATRQARALVVRMLRPLPQRIRRPAMWNFLSLVRGFEAAGTPLRLVPALAVTCVSWLAMSAAVLCVFRALHTPVQAATGMFVAVALTASIAVPQAPGFLGLFHVVMEEAARVWGVPETTAEAGAFVLWFAYVFPVTLWGLIDAGLQGQGFFAVRDQLLSSPAEEAPRPEAPLDAGGTKRESAEG